MNSSLLFQKMRSLNPGDRRHTPESKTMRFSSICRAVNEADNLYKGIPVAAGIIEKRLMEKQMQKSSKEFMAAIKLAEDDDRKVQLMRREARQAPADGDHQGLVEYFLNTVAEDMDFEVSRRRPSLDAAFFRHLDGAIGKERFSGKPDEDNLAEMEALRQYLSGACEAVDQFISKTATAKERVAKLLSSREKKETILEMAASNEIDQGLMDLLTQNIQAARLAGQEDAAKFMEKVMQACAKYYVPPSLPDLPNLPSLPGGMPVAPVPPGMLSQQTSIPAKQSGGGSGIIIPGNTKPPLNNSGGSSGLIIPGR